MIRSDRIWAVVWKQFERPLFLVGAGMSMPSGVALESMPRADSLRFLQQPEQVMAEYRAWRQSLACAHPHAGHAVLRRLGRPIITSNQDGLLQKAGCASVLELHGNAWRNRCVACGSNPEGPCPCGGTVRPDVIWEHEPLVQETMHTALRWISECDCLVCIGTSCERLPAGQLPLRAREKGAYLLEINPNPTAISHLCHECWRGSADSELEKLLAIQPS